MKSYNVHEAKTQLSRLLERVENGEEIVIARNGEPVARLTRIEPQRRRPGKLAGRIVVDDEFDEPLPQEVLAGFEGGES